MIHLLVLLSFSLPIYAQDIYRFGSTRVIFHSKDSYIVNRSCVDQKCMALSLAKKFQDNHVSPGLLAGGKNPGAVKCKELLKGKVIIGKNKKGDEQSFCFFSDESYLQN